MKWHAWIIAIGFSFEHWTLAYANTRDSTGTWDSLLNCERSTPWYMGTRDINDGIGHIQHTSIVVHKKETHFYSCMGPALVHYWSFRARRNEGYIIEAKIMYCWDYHWSIWPLIQTILELQRCFNLVVIIIFIWFNNHIHRCIWHTQNHLDMHKPKTPFIII